MESHENSCHSDALNSGLKRFHLVILKPLSTYVHTYSIVLASGAHEVAKQKA